MSERPLRERITRVGRSPLFALVVVAGCVLFLALAMDTWSYDIWGALWVGPILFALTVPIARAATKRSRDPKLGRLILIAFAVKVVGGSLLRYATIYGLYNGGGDATGYDETGKALAPLFRQGIYENLGKISGTRFTGMLTGQIYAFIGPTRLGGFLVFSWLAFLGLWLLCRAFEIAVPAADHKRYRILVFFFPTMVFWPSSIGKDAWMLFCLGLAAYGVSLVLSGRLVGILPTGLAAWGGAIVRPHIVLLLSMATAAGVAAWILSPRLPRRQLKGRLRSVLVAGVLVVGLAAVVGRAESFFQIDKLDPDSTESVLTDVTDQTAQGESAYSAPEPSSPAGIALALPTVLVRPFPFEARNLLSLGSSIEGIAILVLVIASLGRLSRLPSFLARSPYVLVALVYLLGFAFAFAAIENFGILARQRAQVLPFAFVFLCLPRRERKPRPGREPRRAVRREAAPVA